MRVVTGKTYETHCGYLAIVQALCPSPDGERQGRVCGWMKVGDKWDFMSWLEDGSHGLPAYALIREHVPPKELKVTVRLMEDTHGRLFATIDGGDACRFGEIVLPTKVVATQELVLKEEK